MSARSLPRPGPGPDLAAVRARLAAAARAAAYYGYARPRRRVTQLAAEGRRRWAERAYRPRWAAVQGHGEYASVRGIAGDCLRLRTGELRAVLEVAGVGWRRLPEEEQDALVDAHGWALNALTHPIQWTVLSRPVDLEAQARALERRAARAEAAGAWPEAYLRLIREKADLLRREGTRRHLKRRRYLLTVPTAHLREEEARAELAQRCRDLLDQLERVGVSGRRLTTPELGRLVYDQWHPGVLTSGGGGVPLVAAADEWAYAAAELTLPGRVERHGDDLRVLGEAPGQEWWVRTLALSWWPSSLVGLWLWPLVAFKESVDLALHVTPLDDGASKAHHRQRAERIQDARAWFAHQLPLPARELAFAHTQAMRARLEEGQARAFHAALYALLRAPSRPELDDLTGRVQREVQGLLARSRRVRGEPDRAFLACRPEGTDALGAVREVDTGALAHSFVACTASLATDSADATLYGYDGDQAVVFDRFDPSLTVQGELNSCQVVLGPPGSGKSTYIKRQIPEELARGVAVAVFDVEGEYRPFLDLFGPALAQDVVPDGTTGHRLNVFELPPPDPDDAAAGRRRNPVQAQTLAVLGLLEVALHELTDEESALADRAVLAAYAEKGVVPGDPATWAAPRGVPDMADLERHLARLGAEAAAAGRTREAELSGSLAARLSRYTTGSLAGLFTGAQTVGLDKPFVRFDLTGIAEELYPLVSYLCSTWLWTEQRRRPRKRVFVADEAWRWMRYAPLRRFKQDLARRGRKWLLAPVFVYHSGDDFDDPETRAVLECSSMQYVMRQTPRSIGATARRFALSRGDRQFLLSAKKGEGLFYARGTHVALTLGDLAPAEAPLVLTGLQAHRARETEEGQVGQEELEQLEELEELEELGKQKEQEIER